MGGWEITKIGTSTRCAYQEESYKNHTFNNVKCKKTRLEAYVLIKSDDIDTTITSNHPTCSYCYHDIEQNGTPEALIDITCIILNIVFVTWCCKSAKI